MKLSQVIVVCVLLTLSMAVFAEESKPFAFKGIPLGVSEAEFKSKFDGYHCVSWTRVRVRRCEHGRDTYGGHSTERIEATFISGRLEGVSITLTPEAEKDARVTYKEVIAQLRERHGGFASQETERKGGTTNTDTTWFGSNARLWVTLTVPYDKAWVKIFNSKCLVYVSIQSRDFRKKMEASFASGLAEATEKDM